MLSNVHGNKYIRLRLTKLKIRLWNTRNVFIHGSVRLWNTMYFHVSTLTITHRSSCILCDVFSQWKHRTVAASSRPTNCMIAGRTYGRSLRLRVSSFLCRLYWQMSIKRVHQVRGQNESNAKFSALLHLPLLSLNNSSEHPGTREHCAAQQSKHPYMHYKNNKLIMYTNECVKHSYSDVNILVQPKSESNFV